MSQKQIFKGWNQVHVTFYDLTKLASRYFSWKSCVELSFLLEFITLKSNINWTKFDILLLLLQKRIYICEISEQQEEIPFSSRSYPCWSPAYPPLAPVGWELIFHSRNWLLSGIGYSIPYYQSDMDLGRRDLMRLFYSFSVLTETILIF